MTRLDKVVIGLFLWVLFYWISQSPHLHYDPSQGRRPVPPAMVPPPTPTPPPTPAQPPPTPVPQLTPPPPLPERVRRPPLARPSEGDPLQPLRPMDVASGAWVQGTAFPIASTGLWLTARHAASSLCQEIIMLLDGRRSAAELVYEHPQADLTLIRTRNRTPALVIADGYLSIGQTGYSFGFPTGVLGATEDSLMGRIRLSVDGRQPLLTSSLAWAEVSRFPDTLERLGGISGGPMFDESGEIVGIVIAGSDRRGRAYTVAPELLREVAERSEVMIAPGHPAPADEIVGHASALPDIAAALSRDNRVAKVFCHLK